LGIRTTSARRGPARTWRVVPVPIPGRDFGGGDLPPHAPPVQVDVRHRRHDKNYRPRKYRGYHVQRRRPRPRWCADRCPAPALLRSCHRSYFEIAPSKRGMPCACRSHHMLPSCGSELVADSRPFAFHLQPVYHPDAVFSDTMIVTIEASCAAVSSSVGGHQYVPPPMNVVIRGAVVALARRTPSRRSLVTIREPEPNAVPLRWRPTPFWQQVAGLNRPRR